MAIILTGGTGKTSTRIARLLHIAKIQFLLLSRKGESLATSGMSIAKFDWMDASTFSIPFEHKFENDQITAIYLVAPDVPDFHPKMNAFIDLAVHHGVKRFVVLASTTMTKDSPHHVGPVWQHLDNIGVEYSILKPTWFMDNFAEKMNQAGIKNESKVYTACGDGQISFVSCNDIAELAVKALTATKPLDVELPVRGPELLTHDQIAVKLSTGLERTITNVKLTEDESAQRFISQQFPEWYAKLLAKYQVHASFGSEAELDDVVLNNLGRSPQTFDEWVQENKDVWN